jgi:hypothetical protein
VSKEAERELEAIRAKMARGELDPGGVVEVPSRVAHYTAYATWCGTWDCRCTWAAPVETGLWEKRVPQTPTTGLGAIMGKWPGDETDEEIHAALHPDLPPGFDLGEVVE